MYKRAPSVFSFYHFTLVIMWIGGYDDWTPAEQREWDRDLEEYERLYDEKKKQQESKVNEVVVTSPIETKVLDTKSPEIISNDKIKGSAEGEISAETVVKPMTKGKKQKLPSYRQRMQAIQARMKYREKLIKGFKQHQQKGTFPKRFKSLKPYPKMSTPESQALVNAACQQVECVVLDQMVQEEEMKLKQDQAECQSLKEERQAELSQVQRKKPKMMTTLELQQELKELQAKYSDLCSKLESNQPSIFQYI